MDAVVVIAGGALLWVAAAFPLAAPAGRRAQHVLDGRWGGPHVQLDVTEDGAHLDFDCAQGHIEKPLTLKAGGRFDFKGSYTEEQPGPRREGTMTDVGRAVRYEGRIVGKTMTLTITVEESKAAIGTFTLTQGRAGSVRKCM
jgi:hypothetical protein